MISPIPFIQTGSLSLCACGYCSHQTNSNFIDNLFILCFRQERDCYYGHHDKARSDPDKYLTIILDGMDQNKTNLPYLVCLPKSVQNLQRLRTHLTGALVHTRSPHGKIAYAFFDFLQWPHDSNLNIQVLLEVLLDFRDQLPPTLYLQLDNSARENKNRFFFSFCALLVKRGVFKKVGFFLRINIYYSSYNQSRYFPFAYTIRCV